MDFILSPMVQFETAAKNYFTNGDCSSMPVHERLGLYTLILAPMPFAALFVFRFGLGCLTAFYKFFLRGGKNLTRYGKWAVVTGATDGIGKAMSFELAKKGMNVLLISRTPKKLEDTKAELSQKFPKVSCDILAIDFSNLDQSARDAVKAKFKDLDIGVLVNNVGMSYDHPEFFSQLDEGTTDALIDLNVVSTSFMTHAALQGMESRRRGAIVNISSVAGKLVDQGGNPLLAGYSGAKGFIENFSMALHSEVKGKGIDVQCQSPFFVTTKLAKLRHPSMFIPTPATYAGVAVSAIGYDAQISPYMPHALQFYVLSLLPAWLLQMYVMSFHLSLRKRALKKKQKSQ